MDQHQQMSRHPKSSLTVETSHWSSSSLDSVPFHSSSRPWFPNELENLLSSEKRTLDHWATVQFFFSTAQVRCFWRCFCFRSGLVALFLKTSERGDSWCTDSSFSSLVVKLSQMFKSALLDSILKLAVIPVACAPFPAQFLPWSTLHLICFDTALCKQPPLSAMTFCDLPSLWRVSMIVFWTIAKSAVFPIIVVSKNKRYPEFILLGWSFNETQNVNILIFWDNGLSWAVSSNHQN